MYINSIIFISSSLSKPPRRRLIFQLLQGLLPPLSSDWTSQFLQPAKPFFYLWISFLSCSISAVCSMIS